MKGRLPGPAENFREAIQTINETAFDLGRWPTALERIASLTSCSSAQLIASASGKHVVFIETVGVPGEIVDEMVARGGLTPQINPRVAAGLTGPLMRDLAEDDFVSDDVLSRSSLYQEFFDAVDAYHTVQSNLARWDDQMAALSVFCSRKRGPVPEAQRANFRRVLGHARASVLFRLRLEGEALAIAAGAFDALKMPIILCNVSGRILRVSMEAERLLHEATTFHARGGFLQVTGREHDLAHAIALASHGNMVAGPLPSTLLVSDREGHTTYRLEVRPYAREAHAILSANASSSPSSSPSHLLPRRLGSSDFRKPNPR